MATDFLPDSRVKRWPASREALEEAGYVFHMLDAECRGCGQTIAWVTTWLNQREPLEVQPNGPMGQPDLWRSHFVSCPDANKFRRNSIKDEGQQSLF